MKKFIQLAVLLCVVTAFAAVSAFAVEYKRVDAKIPFGFTVGQKSYPAGDYVLSIIKISSGTSQVTLEDAEGNALETVFAATTGTVVRSGQAARIVFNRYDDRVFLAQINTTEYALAIPASKVERQIVKERKGDRRPAVVALAADR